MFSLATQAKLIALIAFFSFIIYLIALWLIEEIRTRAKNKSILNNLAMIFSGFFTPYLLFELWKLTKLGGRGYYNHWSSYISFTLEKGVSGISFSILNIVERIKIINERFGLFLPIIFIILLINLVLLLKNRKLSQVYMAFFSIFDSTEKT